MLQVAEFCKREKEEEKEGSANAPAATTQAQTQTQAQLHMGGILCALWSRLALDGWGDIGDILCKLIFLSLDVCLKKKKSGKAYQSQLSACEYRRCILSIFSS